MVRPRDTAHATLGPVAGGAAQLKHLDWAPLANAAWV